MTKLLSILIVIFGATLVVTAMLRLVPGDPVDHILGEQAPFDARAKMAQKLGLVDENGVTLNYVQQYVRFVREISTNELRSYRTDEPVLTMIVARLPYTAALAALAMCFALLIGPAFGVLAAWRRGSIFDGLFMGAVLLGVSVPRFFLGPLLLLVFSIYYPIFPVSGVTDGIISAILPAIALGTAMAAIQARLVRASILEVLGEDYIRSARAKGLTEVRVYFKHALRNALLPVVTVIGLEFGGLLAGSIVIEKIFNWPGIGLLLLESIQRLDMPVVQGVVMTIALSYVVINLLTDFAYQLIDPRMRNS